MPRYFFHIHDGTLAPDDTGTELPDIAAAQSAALQTSGEIIKDGSMENVEWRSVGNEGNRRSRTRQPDVLRCAVLRSAEIRRNPAI
jgi:hypothetical protein